ncbi:hypothetical protein DYL61_19405 [Pseudomonas nabeulensis]|uniref:Uncharacterized protein n=1 Tax=Pseudomonas nabeulensis TaxID=2293833 RepID=A0A4Z0AXR7_9PSED|nr:hypothetical protein DYL61_19405 [Pseudomonas nabeulensis]
MGDLLTIGNGGGSIEKFFGRARIARQLGSNVGGGLPPMAVGQLPTTWLTHCYRGQAPSHIWTSLFGRSHKAQALRISSCASISLRLRVFPARDGGWQMPHT